MAIPKGWKWSYTSDEATFFNSLFDSHGRCRATITFNRIGAKWWWHISDERGGGGENDCDADLPTAMKSVEDAHARAEWSNEPPPPPPPEPLSDADVEELDEILRNNGDADEAGAFNQRVLDVIAAYRKAYNTCDLHNINDE